MKKTLELTQENNKILRSIRRSNRWSAFMRVIYWAIIIGASVWSYNFLQPYLKTVLNAYETMQANMGNLNSTAGNAQDSIQDMLNKIRQ